MLSTPVEELGYKLPEHERRAAAIAAANKYARRPEGSGLTYGFVAATMMLMTIIIFGMFYGLSPLEHPVVVGMMMALAFVGGVFLRKRRRRIHNKAFNHEFDDEGSSSSK